MNFGIELGTSSSPRYNSLEEALSAAAQKVIGRSVPPALSNAVNIYAFEFRDMFLQIGPVAGVVDNRNYVSNEHSKELLPFPGFDELWQWRLTDSEIEDLFVAQKEKRLSYFKEEEARQRRNVRTIELGFKGLGAVVTIVFWLVVLGTPIACIFAPRDEDAAKRLQDYYDDHPWDDPDLNPDVPVYTPMRH